MLEDEKIIYGQKDGSISIIENYTSEQDIKETCVINNAADSNNKANNHNNKGAHFKKFIYDGDSKFCMLGYK